MYRNIFFAFCVTVFIISGCNKPQTYSEKQSRLIAAENIELKRQIEELNQKIGKLVEQHQKEVVSQVQLLADAQKEIETLKEQSKQNIHNQVQDVLDAVIQQNTELREELEKLKEQLKF